ncbi:MAG: tetratricopeptide repeat protein [Candidatus Hodarchaeota archaeon]
MVKEKSEYLLEKARKYFQEERFAEAEEVYRELIKMRPKNASYWLDLGSSIVLQGKERLPDAEQAHRNALKIDSSHSEGWYSLGNVYKLQGVNKYQEAEKAYKRSIKLDPTYHSPWHGLYVLYNELGKDDEFKEAYLRWKELFDKSNQ